MINNKYKKELHVDRGINISNKVVPSSRNDSFVKMVIWDIYVCSNDDYIPTTHLKNTSGGLVVCDITQPDTADNLRKWLAVFTGCIGYNVPVVLMANKFDLFGNNPVTSSRAYKILQRMDLPFFITSAKTGYNIKKAFVFLADIMTSEHPWEYKAAS